MMSLHPKIIDLTLDRVWRLLRTLGDPQDKLPPVIHIAGTNAKGSVQAMLRAGLEGAGHLVHAYTSPHLVRFHERIRLAGGLISEPDFARLLDECETANGGAEITFFEITTCAALLAFARIPADHLLLEVGLGGRLDATNVVDRPALTVITPVSYDHQQYLGETLPEIAGEKAGILKRGVPCVVGPQEDTALAVIEAQAARVGAPLLVHGQHWHVWEERGRLVFQDETGLLDLPMPALIGAHQVSNAGIVLAALRAIGAPDTAYEPALTQVHWPARMQRLRTGPLVDAAGAAELWLDGGHNPAAGAALVEVLGGLPHRPLHLICGMLNTKDITGYLRPLAGLAETLHAVDIPGTEAALGPAEVADAALSVGLQSAQSPSPRDAIRRITAADPTARILICGSLYLAGLVLRENG
ncbi:MAG: folylpolyglutamate synthase/dihydrofolate synthase family protein [Rhodobacter sp.]|nr:folylpolyglutamate synthase/dihydrofolate synthase family protein [Rhodobacter sp.]